MTLSQPPAGPSLQAIQDAEHLKLLSIFHYVMAGFAVIGACLASIYVVIGLGIGVSMASGGSTTGTSAADAEMARMVGWMFGLIGGLGTLFAIGLAWCLFLCGRYLSERRNPTFIMVIAAIQCLNMPLGTALGVFTIVVLQRASVKRLFEHPSDGLGAV